MGQMIRGVDVGHIAGINGPAGKEHHPLIVSKKRLENSFSDNILMIHIS